VATGTPNGQMDVVAPPAGDGVPTGDGTAPAPTTSGGSTAGVGGAGTSMGDTAGGSTAMPSTTVAGGDPMMSGDSDDGGCAVVPRRSTSHGAWAMALVAVILGASGLRRRR